MKLRPLLFVLVAALALSADPSRTTASGPETPETKSFPAAAGSKVSDERVGQWTLGRRVEGVVQLTFRIETDRGHSWHTVTIPIEKLEGLPEDALDGGKSAVSFRLVRDAVTFVCDGHVARGQGGGVFEVELDPAFTAGFEQRGLEAPTAREQIEMALGDVGFELIDELRSRGAEVTTAELLRMARHGAGLGFVRELEEAGYEPKTIDELVRTRDHGVTARYIRGLAQAGYRDLPLRTLIRARDHGVDGAFAAALAGYGFQNLELDTVIRARDHGVDGEFVQELADAGYRDLTLDQLITARDHGVDGSFAREVRKKLGEAPSIERLVRIRDLGGLED